MKNMFWTMLVAMMLVVVGCKTEHELALERQNCLFRLGKMYWSLASGQPGAEKWVEDACAEFNCKPEDRQKAIKEQYDMALHAEEPAVALEIFNLLEKSNPKDKVKIFDLAVKKKDLTTMRVLAMSPKPVIDLERQKYWADQQCAWYVKAAPTDIEARIDFGEKFFRLYRAYGSCEGLRHDMGIRLAREYMRQGKSTEAASVLCQEISIRTFEACPDQLFHELNVPPYVTAGLKNTLNSGCPAR